MIPCLELFAKATHSYGWAIVLLTLLVRIIVAPFVASSTKSMQRMSQLQPQLKAIQERYKGEPEQFQKKAMEFYSKNKINPMGGCLPTLVQLPVLFALFATFTGPPFGDKPIDVKVTVVDRAQAAQAHRSEVSGNNSPYVSADGQLAKLTVHPGDSTVVAGSEIDFFTRPIEGKLLPDYRSGWKIIGQAKDAKELAQKATIDSNGHAVFREAGEYHVQAIVPGVAKNEKFGFINGLGKVAQGAALVQPQNWDCLVLILLFGVTMFLSQKFTVAQPKKTAGAQLDEQQLIQQQTMKTMPIAVTAMFFFIPLPTGVYLYMVISNVVQTLQTWLIMKSPAPQLVDVLSDGPARVAQTGPQQVNEGVAAPKQLQAGTNGKGKAPLISQAGVPGAKKRKKRKRRTNQ